MDDYFLYAVPLVVIVPILVFFRSRAIRRERLRRADGFAPRPSGRSDRPSR